MQGERRAPGPGPLAAVAPQPGNHVRPLPLFDCCHPGPLSLQCNDARCPQCQQCAAAGGPDEGKCVATEGAACIQPGQPASTWASTCSAAGTCERCNPDCQALMNLKKEFTSTAGLESWDGNSDPCAPGKVWCVGGAGGGAGCRTRCGNGWGGTQHCLLAGA